MPREPTGMIRILALNVLASPKPPSLGRLLFNIFFNIFVSF
jgi:hypothetical protein